MLISVSYFLALKSWQLDFPCIFPHANSPLHRGKLAEVQRLGKKPLPPIPYK
jgi:hypothetical protein